MFLFSEFGISQSLAINSLSELSLIALINLFFRNSKFSIAKILVKIKKIELMDFEIEVLIPEIHKLRNFRAKRT